MSKNKPQVSHRLVLGPYKVQNGVKPTQKQPSCKKNGAALKCLGEKSCEIQGGGQEMAAMMLILKQFNNGCVHC